MQLFLVVRKAIQYPETLKFQIEVEQEFKMRD